MKKCEILLQNWNKILKFRFLDNILSQKMPKHEIFTKFLKILVIKKKKSLEGETIDDRS